MNDHRKVELQIPIGATVEETDNRKQNFEFGDGGVPWYLLLLYLGFLVFFAWYVMTYQLPDFERQGPLPLPGAQAGN